MSEVLALEFLNDNQRTALYNSGVVNKEDVRKLTLQQMSSIDSIGGVTAQKLREWAKLPKYSDGDAISESYMVIRRKVDGETVRLDVKPGDVIPAEWDAKTRVEQGKARWRTPADV